MKLDEDQVKWLDLKCQKAAELYQKDKGLGLVVSASSLVSLYHLAGLFGYEVDRNTGKLYTENEEKKTRIYVS